MQYASSVSFVHKSNVNVTNYTIKGDSSFAYSSGSKSLEFQKYVPVPVALGVEAGDKVVGFVGILCVVGVFVPKKSGRP